MKPYLLHHLLLESAGKHPDYVAFRHEDQSITYGMLDIKSSRLAHLLVQAGVKPEDPVGIYLDKSLEAMVSFFAVMKAGAVYVPLDSTYSPPERIAGVLKLSRARHVISCQALWGAMVPDSVNRDPWLHSLVLILTDTLFPGDRGEDFHPAPENAAGYVAFYDDSLDTGIQRLPGMTERDLAYILYTSGSTGTPKGVMISHMNALSFVNWALDCFKPHDRDIFSNHAPLNFDLSVFDIYVAVASGACTCLVPFHTALNPRALVAWMADRKITYWYSVPQVWINIMNYAEIEREKLSHLTHVLFAGEVFPTVYLKRLMGLLPGAAFYNLYGPTETNVCTYYHVKNAESLKDRPVPIGKACENAEIIVLNDQDEPVKDGEEGELMVRGPGVTCGYYRDPEKTGTAFMQGPLPEHQGALLYRTGDIVFRTDGGNYVYVGRKDLMVKCSGFRIELPEVEHALFQYDGIEEAVVVAHGENGQGKRLHAFVTARPGRVLSIIHLKKHLAAILPRYMVPDTIETVSAIPRNANGKTDRQVIKGWVSHESS